MSVKAELTDAQRATCLVPLRRRTLDDVRRDWVERPKKDPIVTYSAGTCWWNDDYPPKRAPGSIVPLDPRGSPCLQTEDLEKWLRTAEANAIAGHYGRHGLLAFELALHGNVLGPDGQPTAFRSWEDYNLLLDAEGGATHSPSAPTGGAS